jgi:hypothetical protein
MLLPPNRRGARLTHEQVEQITQDLITHLTASPPLQLTRGGSGINLRLDYEFAFLAKITSGTQPYAWSEVVATTNGTFVTPAVSRSGTTSVNEAWELNGNATVPAGSIVLMTYGFFNFGPSSQEYLFSYNTPGTGGTGSGTKAVPLQVTSQNPVNGLYPAVLLTYNAATNVFSPSATNIWAITTDQNALYVTNYTGILVGNGGQPAHDIYCINDNLAVMRSDGSQRQIGVNQLEFNPPCTWQITPAAIGPPGQALITRLLRFQDSQGNPPVDNVATVQFEPYYDWVIYQGAPCQVNIQRTLDAWNDGVVIQQFVNLHNYQPGYTWTITAGTRLGQVNIVRKFEVGTRDVSDSGLFTDVIIGTNVYRQLFYPSCAWQILQVAPGVVRIARLLTVQDDGNNVKGTNVATLQFQPGFTWNFTALACGVGMARKWEAWYGNASGAAVGGAVVTDVWKMIFFPQCAWNLLPGNPGVVSVQRIFVVQTDNALSLVANDVTGIRFIPDCAWTIGVDAGLNCGVTVKRNFVVQNNDQTQTVSDVANLTLFPSNTWSITPGPTCAVVVERIFNVIGTPVSVAHVWQETFNGTDFVTSSTGAGQVTIGTNGATDCIYYCDQDGTIHSLRFVDGLYKGRDISPC